MSSNTENSFLTKLESDFNYIISDLASGELFLELRNYISAILGGIIWLIPAIPAFILYSPILIPIFLIGQIGIFFNRIGKILSR